MKFFSSITITISVVLISLGFMQKQNFNKKIHGFFKLKPVPEFDCENYSKNQYSSLLNNYLKDYIYVSEKEGIKPSSNLKELREKIKIGKLVGITSKNGYELDTFNYSYAVLTPYSKELLDTIGLRFQNAIETTPLKGSKLIVTSMTRTLYTVSTLVKNNRTAVKRSPHLNGNSFDFSFSRFNTPRTVDNCELTFLQETLSKILFDLKNEKRCWVTFERWEECLHVVAKK